MVHRVEDCVSSLFFPGVGPVDRAHRHRVVSFDLDDDCRHTWTRSLRWRDSGVGEITITEKWCVRH